MSEVLKVLLVEPDYRRNSKSKISKAIIKPTSKSYNDDSLWYPPIGLMKIANFHNNREDKVDFIYGCREESELLGKFKYCDRIYITTLFTFHWDKTIETINYYKNIVNGDPKKIFVGGILASLLPDQVFEATGIHCVTGVINSPQQINLPGNENIDLLLTDYSILDDRLYAINDTYYAYSTRGCINTCLWCGVPKIESGKMYDIDIKDYIMQMRASYGEKSRLKLMDNNFLASEQFETIVNDLINLGYGINNNKERKLKKERVVDFNQGLDASFVTEDRMKLLSKLNIKPMRIAFDRLTEKEEYINAVQIAKEYGIQSFSNYMLYNFIDTPKDLYERLMINIEINESWHKDSESKANIYSYPMRYAPINSTISPTEISQENGVGIPQKTNLNNTEGYNGVFWVKRFVRNMEVMKGVTHGSISPTPSLARRTIGETYEEFVANLYMPEELLRNRNIYEKKVYKHEPKRKPGTGDVERFRSFFYKLFEKKGDRFLNFHKLVTQNDKREIRKHLDKCKDKEMKKWLRFYLK